MIWFVIIQVFSILLEWLSLGRKTEQEKDFEILLLRRQLTILQRRLDKPLRVSWAEKLSLAVLLSRFRAVSQRTTSQLREVIRKRQSSNGIGKLSDSSGRFAISIERGVRGSRKS